MQLSTVLTQFSIHHDNFASPDMCSNLVVSRQVPSQKRGVHMRILTRKGDGQEPEEDPQPTHFRLVGRIGRGSFGFYVEGNRMSNGADGRDARAVQRTAYLEHPHIAHPYATFHWEDSIANIGHIERGTAHGEDEIVLLMLRPHQESVRLVHDLFANYHCARDGEYDNIGYDVSGAGLGEAYNVPTWQFSNEQARTNIVTFMETKKYKLTILPAFVGDDTHPIHPNNYKATLAGALVEVHAVMRNWRTAKEGSSASATDHQFELVVARMKVLEGAGYEGR
ncbi:hypothetical protein OF83DRAFT_1178592 [Amylostereum chailletii]|nr:hypothetical protein OF83DRAFT_1178592 [Amylostereum chailletii]